MTLENRVVRLTGGLGRWQQHRRLIGLLLLLSLLLTIAVPLFRVTIGWDIVAPVRRELALLRAAMTFPLLARKDPAQGSIVPLPDPSQVVVGSLQPDKYKIVLFAGPVSPCVLKSLELYRIVQKAHGELQIVLVFASPTSVVQQAVSNSHKQFVYVSDSEGRYALHLNAFYYPRLYLLDKQNRVLYVQHYRTGSQKALMEAVDRLLEEV